MFGFRFSSLLLLEAELAKERATAVWTTDDGRIVVFARFDSNGSKRRNLLETRLFRRQTTGAKVVLHPETTIERRDDDARSAHTVVVVIIMPTAEDDDNLLLLLCTVGNLGIGIKTAVEFLHTFRHCLSLSVSLSLVPL